MNLIAKRLKIMLAGASDKPTFKGQWTNIFTDLDYYYKFLVCVPTYEFDMTFDVNATLVSGGIADFSTDEFKDAGKEIMKHIRRQIRNMFAASMQDSAQDTVNVALTRTLNSNVTEKLRKNGIEINEEGSKDLFRRSKTFFQVIDEDSIFNNELKLHFKLTSNADSILSKDVADVIADAFNSNKNGCCSLIANNLSKLYKWDKNTNGKGLDVIDDVKIKFKTADNFEFDMHEHKANANDVLKVTDTSKLDLDDLELSNPDFDVKPDWKGFYTELQKKWQHWLDENKDDPTKPDKPTLRVIEEFWGLFDEFHVNGNDFDTEAFNNMSDPKELDKLINRYR